MESKYKEVLSKYNCDLNDQQIATAVQEMKDKKVPANCNQEVSRLLYNCIDLTTLNTTDNDTHVKAFTEKVNQFALQYPEVGNVASICVFPNRASVVRDNLKAKGVGITSVAACFPSSQSFIEVKIAETAMAVNSGATEIDIVLSVGEFLEGDYQTVCEEIIELKEACGKAILKVILETGALTTASNIKKASLLAMYSGADFIKTSTGKISPAATPEAGYVMCQAIKEYYDQTGLMVGFKPAGGVSNSADGAVYYTMVKEILGEKWLTPQYFRIGASRAANAILGDILGKEIQHF